MKAPFFNQKPSRGRPTMGGGAQSSAGPSGAEAEHLSTQQILGQGDFKGESNVHNDPRNAIDRGPKIEDMSVAFAGIQHRSGKFGKEHKKHRHPDNWPDGTTENVYSSHFHAGGSDALLL